MILSTTGTVYFLQSNVFKLVILLTNMLNKNGEVSFGAIVATIGSILIALGVIWLVALNWQSIPAIMKLMIALIATIASYSVGVSLRIKEYPKIGESLLLLGALLFTWTIYLIAQIFNLATSLQANASLLLISFIILFIISYTFNSKTNLFISLAQFLLWVALQYFSFATKYRSDFSPAYLVIIYLVLAMLFYGLTQLHKSRDHPFTEMYRTFTGFYVLVVAYILSFQLAIANLWVNSSSTNMWPVIFILLFFVVSLIIFVVGIFASYDQQKISGKEIFSFLILLLVYITIIALTNLFAGDHSYYRNLSEGMWALWLFDNIIFILVILSVMGYGTKYKSNHLINLGILFFSLEIIARYIGFMLDFGGQIGFAVMSIIGGIILIAGGFAIEKWRKRLIEKATEEKDQGYAIY